MKVVVVVVVLAPAVAMVTGADVIAAAAGDDDAWGLGGLVVMETVVGAEDGGGGEVEVLVVHSQAHHGGQEGQARDEHQQVPVRGAHQIGKKLMLKGMEHSFESKCGHNWTTPEKNNVLFDNQSKIIHYVTHYKKSRSSSS
jgi:hypothetical protein